MSRAFQINVFLLLSMQDLTLGHMGTLVTRRVNRLPTTTLLGSVWGCECPKYGIGKQIESLTGKY